MFIMLYRENIKKKIFLSKTTGQIWKRFGNCSPDASKIHSWMFDLKVNIKQSFLGEQPKALSFLFCDVAHLTGFPQALEIMENLENHPKKFHAWINHGI